MFVKIYKMNFKITTQNLINIKNSIFKQENIIFLLLFALYKVEYDFRKS